MDGTNQQIAADFQRIKENLIDFGLNYFAIFAPILTAISMLRIIEHGWQWVYLAQICGATQIVVTAIIKKHLSYRWKGWLFLSPSLVISWIGFVTLGLAGVGALTMVLSAIAATVIFSARTGLVIAASNLVVVLLTGLGIHLNILEDAACSSQATTSLSSWFNVISAILLWGPGLILLLGAINRRLLEEMARHQDSERKYSDVFDAVSDTIFIHHHKTGVIIDVNESMLKMFGYEKDEVIGFSIEKFMSGEPPFDMTVAQKHMANTLEIGEQTFEWQCRRRSGQLFCVEVKLQVITVDNRERILAVVRDITERKRTNEILIQNEKMMSIGGLAAGMAHEINNPIGGMIQLGQVISSRLTNTNAANERAADQAGTSTSAIAKYMELRRVPKMLKEMSDSGLRASRIVANMLSFARQEDSRHVPTNIVELMNQTISIARSEYDLKERFDFKHIQIETEYSKRIPLLYCEPGKIQQVFLNVLRNGAQAMAESATEDRSDGPKSRFTIRMESENENQTVRIEIEDNGPGMEENVSRKIFEPFFTTKKKGRGTGLGLSVSYFIITNDHNGQMFVESQKGVGSRFVIILPVNFPPV